MFELSQRSLDRMKGLHPDLVEVVKRAIEYTEVDFTVLQGVRTIEEERENFAKGASQTMNSRHLTGKAVDVGALVDGQYDGNNLALYAKIANAFRQASFELEIPIRWGGCWKELSSIPEAGAAMAAYGREKRAAGGRPFYDAGHFELPARVYP